MELFIRLDPTDLPRLRRQAILQDCRQGRGRNMTEEGALHDSADGLLLRNGTIVTVIREGGGLIEIIRRAQGVPSRLAVGDDHTPLPPPEFAPLCLQKLFDYQLKRSVIPLGGPDWRAELVLEHCDVTPPGEAPLAVGAVTCRLIEGPVAPLASILQQLAERLDLRLAIGPIWILAFERLRREKLTPVKSKAPPLAPDAGNREALQIIGRAGLTHLLRNHACLIETGDAEAIHQMRVALRRLRSAMSLFKIMLNDAQSEALRGELRWMQQMLGAARDGDVLLAEIVQPLDRLYQNLPGLEALKRVILDSGQRERAAMA